MAITNTCTNRPWYRAYCAAMLETDVNKIFAAVESARKAIQDRALELSHSLSASNHESRELDRATRFLAMLLDCSRVDNNQPSILLTRDGGFRATSRALANAVQ